MRLYRAGIDIGSTTVKLVLLDEKGGIVFGKYIRHRAHTREALGELLLLPPDEIRRKAALLGGQIDDLFIVKGDAQLLCQLLADAPAAAAVLAADGDDQILHRTSLPFFAVPAPKKRRARLCDTFILRTFARNVNRKGRICSTEVILWL